MVAVTLAMLLVVLSGCLGGPDLSGRADDIGGVLSAMPGVEDVETSYQNGFDAGVSIGFDVTMAATATDSQAGDVAARLDSEIGDEFDRYDQKLRLLRSGQVIEVEDQTHGDVITQKIPRMLALASSLSADELNWNEASKGSKFENDLEIRDPQANPYDTLDAVRAQFGSEDVQLRMNQVTGADWNVTYPFSQQAQDEMESEFVPLLDKMTQINIDHDDVTLFYAVVPDGSNLVGRLRGIIELIDSTTTEPWDFHWALGQASTNQFDSSTGGIVNVGGCEYGEGEGGRQTQEAAAAQDQLRDIYDTCR